MTTTVTTNITPMNVTASLETSDNSPSNSFWQRNGERGEDKKPKKASKKAFFEGSVPAKTWGIYADLAGLMNAICLLQTQSAFLNQAKSAIVRLDRLSHQAEADGSGLDQTTTIAELAAFIADVLHKTQHKTVLNEDETATNALAHNQPKQLLSNSLNDRTDWNGFDDLIQNKLELLENQEEHLLGLARSARLRIEESNHPGVNTVQQNISDATNRSLHELSSQSFKAFQSQITRLPKKVLCLISN